MNRTNFKIAGRDYPILHAHDVVYVPRNAAKVAANNSWQQAAFAYQNEKRKESAAARMEGRPWRRK